MTDVVAMLRILRRASQRGPCSGLADIFSAESAAPHAGSIPRQLGVLRELRVLRLVANQLTG